MQLNFTKMQGLGNDFVVLDGIRQSIALSPEQIRHLGDRHFGVGCDQILLVEAYAGAEADFRYRIFNADGSEVEQCGNGARCFARFVREQGLTDKTSIPVMTTGGRIMLNVEPDNQITVDMGIPRLEPDAIPFMSGQRQALYHIKVNSEVIALSAVSMGNPHAVIRVEQVDDAPVARLGPALERHPDFPQGANIGFMQVVSRQHIRLRVFERGGVETLACGSGACAAVVAGRLQELLDEQVQVDLPGGSLQIVWPGEQQPVLMTGPAETVFSGKITL
ncbi:MAG: diaminopimelate epimerase [Thiolinea sp.]